LPDTGSEYEGAGGTVADAVSFLLSNFAEMNKLSKAIYAKNTLFVNTHGLENGPKRGYSTAADMARFARSGGEANAIAIRIARAATGKDKVAICGYHGWHDWYVSVTDRNAGIPTSIGDLTATLAGQKVWVRGRMATSRKQGKMSESASLQ
jgi:4-aminobutyrate aminotransferase-like enzyme